MRDLGAISLNRCGGDSVEGCVGELLKSTKFHHCPVKYSAETKAMEQLETVRFCLGPPCSFGFVEVKLKGGRRSGIPAASHLSTCCTQSLAGEV